MNEPVTMKVNDVEYVRKDSIQDRIVHDDHPYEIGANFFIRTVTHYFTGQLLAVYEQELVIDNAAWIADTGRYSDALKSGNFKEVEPYPDGPVIIGRGAIIDAKPLDITLPRDQK